MSRITIDGTEVVGEPKAAEVGEAIKVMMKYIMTKEKVSMQAIHVHQIETNHELIHFLDGGAEKMLSIDFFISQLQEQLDMAGLDDDVVESIDEEVQDLMKYEKLGVEELLVCVS